MIWHHSQTEPHSWYLLQVSRSMSLRVAETTLLFAEQVQVAEGLRRLVEAGLVAEQLQEVVDKVRRLAESIPAAAPPAPPELEREAGLQDKALMWRGHGGGAPAR